jgi:hypothetical protein
LTGLDRFRPVKAAKKHTASHEIIFIATVFKCPYSEYSKITEPKDGGRLLCNSGVTALNRSPLSPPPTTTTDAIRASVVVKGKFIYLFISLAVH